jgi:hypothetical protein
MSSCDFEDALSWWIVKHRMPHRCSPASFTNSARKPTRMSPHGVGKVSVDPWIELVPVPVRWWNIDNKGGKYYSN